MDSYVISLVVVFCFIIADIVTGLIASLKAGAFKSSAMRNGLIAKTGELFALGLMIMVEKVLPYVGISVDIPFASFITIYIVIMEIGSNIENIGKINPMLTGPLNKLFDQLKDYVKVGDNDGKEDPGNNC